MADAGQLQPLPAVPSLQPDDAGSEVLTPTQQVLPTV